MAKKKTKNIVVIGGGTGTYTVLKGLKDHDVNLTAVVSMMDSGGSNRILRDEFGLLPTSDIRQCIVALADEDTKNDDLRKLFTYRYESGTGISGMTFGNLFMAALTDIYGSQKVAIKKTCELLHVKGEILPVTYDNSHLVARYDNGKQVLGEHFIDEPEEEIAKHKIIELELLPKASVNREVVSVINNADLIVIGPGDLFTSIICNLIVDGVVNAIKDSKAKCVYVMNLMTKYGETTDYTANDHLRTLENYLGKGTLDFCLVNSSKSFPRGIISKYKEERAKPVKNDLKNDHFKVVRRSMVGNKVYQRGKSDLVKRSLIRHDPKKLAKALLSLL
ncbi:YvcK family protein [Candidatus Woesebacteria bacterium]|nr:YvcK family protein [Candidatus Woesebacteria bacterium]